MAYCVCCGAPLGDGAFCPNCGANNNQAAPGGVNGPFCGASFATTPAICPVCNKNIYSSPAADSLHQIGSGLSGLIDGALNSLNQPVRSDPPLSPLSSSSFHVILGGQSSGPYTVSVLNSMIQARQVDRQTPVWKPGMPQWAPAGSIPELQYIFNSFGV